MSKVVTPGDREHLLQHLAPLMAELEISMPLRWNTPVMHYFVFHTLENLRALGPFVASNILDIERFHTLFKQLARAKFNVMASIKNHFLLLEASMTSRLHVPMTWVNSPSTSSVVGMAARLDSADKADRMWSVLGPRKPYVVPQDDVQQLQTLWADHYDDYANLHRKFRASTSRKRAGSVEEWKPKKAGSKRKHGEGDDRLIPTPEELKWQQMSMSVQVM